MRRNSDAPSSCRIERKRAHDREAQRASRAKTKAYITHLEKTVADLTAASGDNRANYLAQHASQQAQEIDTLQGLVGKIRSLVQDATKGDDSSSSPDKSSTLKNEGTAPESIPEDSAPEQLNGNWDSPSEDQWVPEVPRADHAQQNQQRSKSAPASRNLIVLGENMLCEDDEETSFFPRLNSAIAKVEQTPDNLSTYDEDMDIIVRAVAHGWDAAERIHHFDICWRFLRAFDEGFWYRAGRVERLSNLWNMRSVMLHKIQPRNQPRRAMAPFMEPTLGQKAIDPHPPVIDYFGWPQIRDHLLVQGIAKTTGKQTIAFAESFVFTWPYELRDVYKVDTTTGLHSLTEAFFKHFNDISNYGMVQNKLIPFYVNPTLAKSSPGPTWTDGNASVQDDDNSALDGDISARAAAVEAIANQAAHIMNHGTHAEHWIPEFNVEMSEEAARYNMDGFLAGISSGVSQWPDI